VWSWCFKGRLCCDTLCGSGWSQDLVSFSLPFLFPVLFSDTADLQQSDSVSNYDEEVCGVVNFGRSFKCYSCAATENLANYVNYIRSAFKKIVGEPFNLRNRKKKPRYGLRRFCLQTSSGVTFC